MGSLVRCCSLVAALIVVQACRADSFYPMLMSVSPVAVQTGTTGECEISARYNLHGAYKIFVTGEGVTGEADLPKADPKKPAPVAAKIKVRFKVAPDATPGVREVRVATPLGVSTVGQLVVVRDPVTPP